MARYLGLVLSFAFAIVAVTGCGSSDELTVAPASPDAPTTSTASDAAAMKGYDGTVKPPTAEEMKEHGY